MEGARFLDESEAFAWYEIGYREYEKGNYEEMNKAYAKSVHFMKQISREDRYQRISDMLYSCFYYGVSDEHKASHVSLLQEALYYAQKIEIPEEKAYFLAKIQTGARILAVIFWKYAAIISFFLSVVFLLIMLYVLYHFVDIHRKKKVTYTDEIWKQSSEKTKTMWGKERENQESVS